MNIFSGLVNLLKRERPNNARIYIGRKQAGVMVDEDRALIHSAVWASVRLISETVAALPWRAHRRLERGNELMDGSDLDYILHVQANPEQSAFSFRETALAHALLWGNGYGEIERNNRGEPWNIWTIPPDVGRVTLCTSCGIESPAGARFCMHCAAPLPLGCAACGAELPKNARFCPQCAHPAGAPAATAADTSRVPTRGVASYTPKHLADKILASKSALEGERKQVTVLFADVKGSMELAEQLDPEALTAIMQRFFKILSEGDGLSLMLQVEGEMEALIKALAAYPVVEFETERPSLEEVFLASYEK